MASAAVPKHPSGLPIGFTLEGVPLHSYPEMTAYTDGLKSGSGSKEEGRRRLAQWQSLTNVRRLLAVSFRFVLPPFTCAPLLSPVACPQVTASPFIHHRYVIVLCGRRATGCKSWGWVLGGCLFVGSLSSERAVSPQ